MTLEPTDDSIRDGASEDAAAMAGGSATIFAGGMLGYCFRFATTWFLSRTLGAAAFGLYTFGATVVYILYAIAPLGLDAGLVLFGSRYHSTQQWDRFKGTLIASARISLVSGSLFSCALFCVGRWAPLWSTRPELGNAIQWASGAVLCGTLIFCSVGALQAVKDMRAQTLLREIGLPGGVLLGCLICVGFEGGVKGALFGFVLGHLLVAIVCLPVLYRRFGALLADKKIQARMEVRTLLAFSIPESFARVVFRLNLWTDLLMLTWLATTADVGLYRVAVSLSMLGAIPVIAFTTMFNPLVAELVYKEDTARLDALLKTATRWIIILSCPLYLTLLVVPELTLSIFGSEYISSAGALLILILGQSVYLCCSIAGSMLPMAGLSRLNLLLGLVGFSVNLVLNYLLIPTHGLLGAATASATALSLWSIWRLWEVKRRLHCFPFTLRTTWLVTAMVGCGFLARHISAGQGTLLQLGTTAGMLLTVAVLVWTTGRTPEDEVIIGPLRARWASLRG